MKNKNLEEQTPEEDWTKKVVGFLKDIPGIEEEIRKRHNEKNIPHS